MIWPFVPKHQKEPKKPEVELYGDEQLRRANVYFLPSEQKSEYKHLLHGSYVRSQNEQYILVWRDGNYYGSKEGSYAFFDGEQLIVEEQMERIYEGHVAENGNFVLVKGHFGEGLENTLYAFDKTGSILLHRKFEANLINSGFSLDGRFIAHLTAGGSHPDANKLTLFELENGKALWSIPFTFSKGYDFEPPKGLLWLTYLNDVKYAYCLKTGDFLDRDRMEEDCIASDDAWSIMHVADARFKRIGNQLTPESGIEIVSLLKRALAVDIAVDIDDYPSCRAKVLRKLGEVWEKLGDDLEALIYYEQAIITDSKVGVKRRAASLKKRIKARLS